MTREDINKQVVDLAQKNNNILLTWATGVGKSKAAIDIINKMIEESLLKVKVLLLVNETAHKDNWKEQFKEWNLEECDLTMECYASLGNYKDTSWDIIVADEAHHLGSENRLSYISTMKTVKFLCLSATMPKDVLENLESIRGRFVEHNVSFQDAISYGMMPTPIISLIRLKLDYSNPTEEIVEKWGPEASRRVMNCCFKDRFKYLNKTNNPACELHIKCTQLEKYNYINTKLEYWKNRYMTTKLQFSKNQWLHAGSERKRFLGECKTAAAHRLIGKAHPESRYICFCTSIKQANDLGGVNALHSKTGTKKVRENMIKDFNAGKENRIYAVGMLQEGMNLKNLDWGMIVQLDGFERGWVQKIGRMMRGTKPVILILYYENTQDAEYLKKVVEGIDNSYIKHYSV